MNEESWTPDLIVPTIGPAFVGFDRLRIVSSRSIRQLNADLPLDHLRQYAHRIAIGPLEEPHPHYRSVLDITCAANNQTVYQLAAVSRHLGAHSVSKTEIALDVPKHSLALIKGTQDRLTLLNRKRWSSRRFVSMVGEERNPFSEDPPDGCLYLPTVYYENGDSNLDMKIYGRFAKMPDRCFSEEMILRVEWTARRARIGAIFGGNSITDLAATNLIEFVRANLYLEEFNPIELGRLIVRGEFNPERARRGALLLLRTHAYEQEDHFEDWEQALRCCQGASSEIRPFLRRLMEKPDKKGPGRPKADDQARGWPFTDYRINKCFTKIPL